MALTCIVDGCDNAGKITRGMCRKHYARWLWNGDPVVSHLYRRPAGLTTLRDVFESLPTEAIGDCIALTKCVNAIGYGQVSFAGKMLAAHRISYELYVAPIPNGMEIDHACRVRRCINPSHLRLVTRRQNMQNQPVKSNNSSGARGVRALPNGKWRATVKRDGATVFDRVFDTFEDAEREAMSARLRLMPYSVEETA